ncbi:MAG: hypothetical protein Q9226_002734 [Calogaya cf. arnoldii]
MDRKADPETQLEVDEAILDYLIYNAILSLLELLGTNDISPRKEQNAHLLVQMVDSFLSVFRSLHTNHNAAPVIQLRLRLLQFAFVFVQHYHPFSANTSLSTRASVTVKISMKSTSEDPDQERSQAMSLEQTLPLFLALSAAQNELQGSTITEIWMMLAAGYMAQAYIEQVVVYQNERPGLLEEAFHWGYDEDCHAEEASEERQINDMFGADGSSIRLWASIRAEHVEAGMAAGTLSVVTFKEKVSEFLAGLLSAYQPPLLIQLESGEVDGLSRKATETLKLRSGFTHQAVDDT